MQPTKEPSENEPEPMRDFRGHGWYNLWGVLLFIFTGLLGVCAFWIIRLGFSGAFDNNQFGYALVFAVISGICLIGRWSIPDALLNGSSVDSRSADYLRQPWYFRQYFRRRR